MAKLLSETRISRLTEPGKYMDAYGLFLRVTKSGGKQWVQRITIDGTRRDIGLGGWPIVTADMARAAALDNRRQVAKGGNPLAEKNKPGVPTFAEAARATIRALEPNWKDGSKTAALWRSTLETYTGKIAGMRVDQIEARHILAVLEPVWIEKPETGRKLRQRIGAVMKRAVAQGWRDTDPTGPALTAALPSQKSKAENFRALPHGEVAAALRTVHSSGARRLTKLAFEFLVLTAARSGEVRGARWDEIEGDVWTVPAARTKTGKPHRVPLSDRAVAVLAEAKALGKGKRLIFPSPFGKMSSDSTMSKLLRENGVAAVPHGFRSSFRDWCGETGAPRDISEAALAHTVQGVEGAYFRSDLFNRRKELMQKWADYLGE